MARRFDPSMIPGWGADLDRRQRPAVPMERQPARLDHVDPLPPRQQSSVEILQSIEGPYLTPVFGSTLPPRGLSGWIRRRAFRHSESNLRPALPDNLPRIDTELGLTRINGLFRHGWLIAPALVEDALAMTAHRSFQ